MKEPKIKMSELYAELDKFRKNSRYMRKFTQEQWDYIDYARSGNPVSWTKIGELFSLRFGIKMSPKTMYDRWRVRNNGKKL